MYLLDTNILSELVRKRPNHHLIGRLKSQSPENLFTSCICVMELRMGSCLREDSDLFWAKICEEILSRVKVLPFGTKEAMVAGDILASLRRTGQTIGVEDVFIAATGITHRFTAVTANVSHFIRIKGLKIENWLQE